MLISRLTCSLVGTQQTITLLPGTLARRLYGQSEVTEEFSCSYGLNPRYRAALAASALTLAGVDPDDEVRLVELPTHPFFLATLFLPQVRSTAEQPHPLILAYLQAAADATD